VSRASIQGFDYRTQQVRSLPASEWRDELQAVIRKGGRRRVEAGETFATIPGLGIQFEVYANINVGSSISG
jgi:hypothetical protein